MSGAEHACVQQGTSWTLTTLYVFWPYNLHLITQAYESRYAKSFPTPVGTEYDLTSSGSWHLGWYRHTRRPASTQSQTMDSCHYSTFCKRFGGKMEQKIVTERRCWHISIASICLWKARTGIRVYVAYTLRNDWKMTDLQQAQKMRTPGEEQGDDHKARTTILNMHRRVEYNGPNL